MTDILGNPLKSFRDDLWLGRFVLSPTLALEYFFLSPFHDPNSLNMQRKMNQLSCEEVEGIEYKLIYVNEEGLDRISLPPGSTWIVPNQFGIFIIQKFLIQYQREVPLQLYYIIAGTIYEAPSLSSIFLHRVAEAFRNLEITFDLIKGMSEFSLNEGYNWNSKLNKRNLDSKIDSEPLVTLSCTPNTYQKVDNVLVSNKKALLEILSVDPKE
ncbi:uncharacterized protein CMU_039270 [Cryptosporidium muris RN66]|uniref:Mediator of RNA polymerase II transcription subunit 6 n=1 Tax=Cryptosporidium muris (strain RN66) TaxID=441375 RepID=B6A9G9_CRYMR|nr:uncharacterized protein CMU_039270 [Cryptosporidium muris RN66]EEA04860.1 hypothetical protein CMU_039270 [Cryptosporidium muris RN66]|eukprot:XP_002139209.1 hypothetical protein [Cryptosporidium muris RN66]